MRRLALPRPGPVWGMYPERPTDGPAARANGAGAGWLTSDQFARTADRALAAYPAWLAMAAAQRDNATRILAARLTRDGLTPARQVQALACVTARVKSELGIQLHRSQLICAAALLAQRLCEMATGEGKTLAAGVAAAVGALAGAPVHVITANEYLAQRDARTLAPVFASLGIEVAAAIETDTPEQRRRAWSADVVYATARIVAFDWLRDRMVTQGLRSELMMRAGAGQRAASPALLRGLCMAIVDEADSVLIDEAKMPLILGVARTDPRERALVWQSLDLAGRLTAQLHFTVEAGEHRALLTQAGRDMAATLAAEYGGGWLNRQHREELVGQALTALHALQRDSDYLVASDEVSIIDAITGRSAPGRVWSRGLHIAVALKERLRPPPSVDTQARTTYPLLFARYHHLSGLSGTLHEVRGELRRDYALPTIAVPLRVASRRRHLPKQLFTDRRCLFEAALMRVRGLIGQGRPVLLVTDTVTETRQLADLLHSSGVPCALLNAETGEQEAALIRRAGQAPVHATVATQVAGRGTDILLSARALRAGGLHVLSLQHNRSRRIDRQIAGRAARHGEPGSFEHWVRLDAPLFEALVTWRALLERLPVRGGAYSLDSRFVTLFVARAQRIAEREDAIQRRDLGRQDKDWARRLHFSPNEA